MTAAYVLVKAATGEAERMQSAMRDLPGVDRADIVAGDVDFVVKVDVAGPDEVGGVAERIRGVAGVVDTQTYITMD